MCQNFKITDITEIITFCKFTLMGSGNEEDITSVSFFKKSVNMQKVPKSCLFRIILIYRNLQKFYCLVI